MGNYQNYVANSLFLHGQGKAYTMTLEEMTKPSDNRTGDEIAVDVILQLGLKFEE